MDGLHFFQGPVVLSRHDQRPAVRNRIAKNRYRYRRISFRFQFPANDAIARGGRSNGHSNGNAHAATPALPPDQPQSRMPWALFLFSQTKQVIDVYALACAYGPEGLKAATSHATMRIQFWSLPALTNRRSSTMLPDTGTGNEAIPRARRNFTGDSDRTCRPVPLSSITRQASSERSR